MNAPRSIRLLVASLMLLLAVVPAAASISAQVNLPHRIYLPIVYGAPSLNQATAEIRINNDTGGPLTISLSGPTAGSRTIATGGSLTLNVMPGTYQITATARCGTDVDTFTIAAGEIEEITYFCTSSIHLDARG